MLYRNNGKFLTLFSQKVTAFFSLSPFVFYVRLKRSFTQVGGWKVGSKNLHFSIYLVLCVIYDSSVSLSYCVYFGVEATPLTATYWYKSPGTFHSFYSLFYRPVCAQQTTIGHTVKFSGKTSHTAKGVRRYDRHFFPPVLR